MDYEADTSLKREDIRELSKEIRRIFKVETINFPVLKVLPRLEQIYEDALYTSIDEDSEFDEKVMTYLEEVETDKYCIHVRQSVYIGATINRGDCLGFINHELSHFILVHILGIKPVYNRSFSGRIPAYKSMEWQAKALCGELMIPYDLCKDMDICEILDTTNSSLEQAKFFIKRVVK